jgi:hypothetical protein
MADLRYVKVREGVLALVRLARAYTSIIRTDLLSPSVGRFLRKIEMGFSTSLKRGLDARKCTLNGLTVDS